MPTEQELLAALAELIQLTNHAVNRYRMRCRPELATGQARKELRRRILHEGVLQDEAPEWLYESASGTHHADCWVIVGGEVALPLRGDDPRGDFRRLVAVTAMTRGFEAPAHPSDRAKEWDERRRQAALLQETVIVSQRAVRRYRQQRTPLVSAHADLVEHLLAGAFTTELPSWSPHPYAAAVAFLICDKESFAVPLKPAPLHPGKYLADSILWADWRGTGRQRQLQSAA